MIGTLVLAAAFGLGVSAASACDFQRSAELDKTVVASIPTEQKQSTPVATQIPPDQLAIDQAAPVDQAENSHFWLHLSVCQRTQAIALLLAGNPV